jgi:hypothetical protein
MSPTFHFMVETSEMSKPKIVIVGHGDAGISKDLLDKIASDHPGLEIVYALTQPETTAVERDHAKLSDFMLKNLDKRLMPGQPIIDADRRDQKHGTKGNIEPFYARIKRRRGR